ncbi:peptidoglycan-binding protein [Xylaria palmicola]|nr:peptidoglycan-binding protein [Xylaria palmicola]
MKAFICLMAFSAYVAVYGQQFDGYTFPYEILGLSDSCLAAVNVTVSSCPAWLARYTGIDGGSVDTLLSEQLGQLCDSSCQKDLSSLRTSISGACKEPTDVMMPNDIAYPPTFLADRFLYAASLSCLKDSSTAQYCDLKVAGWADQENYTDTQLCSYCQLKVQQLQLASPFGYREVFADSFANITAHCSATGYGYATPTQYALNATTSAPATPTCTGSPYTVQDGDTCIGVSGSNGMSTYNLITSNALSVSCADSLAAGTSLCLEKTCSTYQLQYGDTCDSLSAEWNVTFAQLRAWNPMINVGCSNLASWRGWYLCSSSPSPTVTINPGNAVTTVAPVPTDAQPQSNTRCGTWYYVLADETCQAISLKFGISLNDFYFLNPQVDTGCSNLWANTSYCVAAVGNVATYSGYVVTTSATTFTKPPSSTIFVPSPVATPPLNAQASGTISGCFLYENAFNATVANQSLDDANSCQNWAQLAEVSVDNLREWNPSLSAGECVLKTGLSYCVRVNETIPSVTYPHDYCIRPDATRIPDGTAQPSDCKCYTQFREIDKKNFNCSMVPDLLGMTVKDLVSLNPWIGSDCDAGIWSHLNSEGYVQLCVESGSTGPSTTPTSPGSSTPTSGTPTTPTYAPPAETQPGAPVDCMIWHKVVDGDGCWSIADHYAITTDEFYKLNPGVGTDCGALWLGYAVCVGKDLEVQTGVSSKCTRLHKVVSGDGCWAISNEYGITLDEFYRLNPGVGTDCNALWLGYAVCVSEQ